jgi:polysaccharide pyruvyl transferase WcaK-like protein
MRIGLLGAFGVNNAGDNLEAVAARAALKKVLPRAEISVFSILFSPATRALMGAAGVSSPECPVQPVDLMGPDFWRLIIEYDSLIIGGGGLLIPVPEFEPLLMEEVSVNPAQLPKTIWNALGSQWTPLADPQLTEWYAKVRRAAERVDYISVRSQTTRRLLERVGCPPERIHLVPDPVISLKIDNLAEIGNQLRETLGLDRDRPVIGISVGPELTREPLKEFLGHLAGALNQIKTSWPRDAQIIIFPFGLMYGDGPACKQLAELCPRSLLVEKPLTALEIWALVSLLDAYLTVRYHGVIAGLAHGVPTLALDCYLANETLGSKLRDLAWQSGLEAYYFSPLMEIGGEPSMRSFAKLPAMGQISRKLTDRIAWLLTAEAQREWKESFKRQEKEVAAHFQRMAQVLDPS